VAVHARTEVRDYVYGLIYNGSTAAGTDVYDSRVWPYEDDDLPAVAVYALEDRTVGEVKASGEVERLLILRVEMRAKAASGMEDTLDQLDAEVQALLLADSYLGGKVKDIQHSETAIELSGDQEKPVGRATADYAILYRIDQAAPDVLL